MKVIFAEHGNSHTISLEAEDVAEAAMLVRMGINGTKKITVSVDAYRSGVINGHISVFSQRRQSSTVKG